MRRYSLAAALSDGNVTISNKELRGSNKGITELSKIPQAETIDHLLLSSNHISNLIGIENFTKLRVLSLSFNNISLISELDHLANINLVNISLEGNPITAMPYYQHRVINAIPSLKFFDGHKVTDTNRKDAQKAVETEESHLLKIWQNDFILSVLDSLKDGQSTITRQKLQKALSTQPPKPTSKDYDQMRSLAVDFRSKIKKSTNWDSIYTQLERNQSRWIKDVTDELESQIQPEKEVFIQPQTPKIKSPEIFEASPSPRHSAPICQSEHHEIDFTAFLRKCHQKRFQSLIFRSWKKVCQTPNFDNQVRRFQVANAFNTWKRRRVVRKPTVITDTKAIDQVQELVGRISILETRLEEADSNKQMLETGIADLSKEGEKMKNIICRLTREKNALSQRCQEADSLYEEEIIQLNLNTKYRLSKAETKISDLESKIAQLEAEKAALNQFIDKQFSSKPHLQTKASKVTPPKKAKKKGANSPSAEYSPPEASFSQSFRNDRLVDLPMFSLRI